MELKFNSVEELIEFIEKMGWVKKDENDKENGGNLTLTKVSSCPYGFINCPYNKSITPYYPTITTPYCNTDVGASRNAEWEQTQASTSGDETVTINMKDISQNVEK